MRECEAMAVLVGTQGISYGRREAALALAGSALQVLKSPRAYAGQLGESGCAALERCVQASGSTLDGLARAGIELIARGEAGYPERLAQIAHPPHLLYVLGEPRLNDPVPIAVVGTRRAGEYGLRQTRRIACDLARAGVCVVSGLALGIDAAGHEGALDGGGRTIAVLGGALDRFYPEANRPLLERILHDGGSVVTEYPPGTAPGRYTFLQRNRIIAGLSLGVLVTCAPARSGAKNTAQSALEEGREVFALPGSVEDAGSALPHLLIAEGARLITCAQDILNALVIEPHAALCAKPKREIRWAEQPAAASPTTQATAPKTPAPTFPDTLSAQETAVCRALSGGVLEFDALCMQTGMDSAQLGALLIEMEMDGRICALPGLSYGMASCGKK